MKVARVGALVLFLTLKEKLRFSRSSVMLSTGLSYVAFVVLRCTPSLPALLKVFILSRCWMLHAFSASVEIVIRFVPFFLLLQGIMLIELQMLSHPCIPGINSTWSWCMTFECIVEFTLLIFCLGCLQLCSSGILACNFFSCGILILFWYQDSAGLVELIWKSSFLFGGRVWKRPVLILPWIFGGIHQGSHLVQNFCLVGGFWLLIQSP